MAASPYDFIPDDLKKQAAAESEASAPAGKKKSAANRQKPPQPPKEEKKQRRVFKKRRAGVVLSRNEVKAIKAGRKKLRKELKAKGIKSRQEFELMAGSMGLYFDKGSAFWAWLWSHWLAGLIGMLLAFLGILFIFSLVQQMRGHFTINLSSGMFKEGFTLSDTIEFTNPTTALFANPAQDVPCISINQLPADIDRIDGEHNDLYFAYTYYIRNEGENSVGYDWALDINAETLAVSDAVWVALFEDGRLRIYAKANRTTGKPEALPAFGDDTRGYRVLPIRSLAPDSSQFEVVRTVGQIDYWRVIPDVFESDTRITSGRQTGVLPMEVHKYTVVMWLEGDDESATDEVIGGHMGVEMNFRLTGEDETTEDQQGNGGYDNGVFGERWKKFWDNLFNGLEG